MFKGLRGQNYLRSVADWYYYVIVHNKFAYITIIIIITTHWSTQHIEMLHVANFIILNFIHSFICGNIQICIVLWFLRPFTNNLISKILKRCVYSCMKWIATDTINAPYYYCHLSVSVSANANNDWLWIILLHCWLVSSLSSTVSLSFHWRRCEWIILIYIMVEVLMQGGVGIINSSCFWLSFYSFYIYICSR